jgi:uncharacterized protein YkwD
MRISSYLWGCLATFSAVATPSALAGGDDVVEAVQILREGGCGGHFPAARPLNREAPLDRAAAQWAGGSSLAAAAQGNGYAADSLAGVHVTGPDSSLVDVLRGSGCRSLTDRGMHDVGVYHRGRETWLILASRSATSRPGSAMPSPVFATTPPLPAPTSPVASTSLTARALELVNDIRAHGTRCGNRSFGPAPPVRLSTTLNDVAQGHATDMARHEYFEHQDLSGRSPADRVRAVGYPEKLVGENIAYGPESADEVVKGWLDSPGHCENIMDPRFAEMGIAYSTGQTARRGLYWVQLLVAPKA